MEELTVMEVLRRTVNEIKEISIPVALAEQIARPLCGAVANLEAVISAIKEPKGGDENVSC